MHPCGVAMPIHWYALLFDLIFHFIMFSVSGTIYLNILSSFDLKLWISNWNNLQKHLGYNFFTKLHWCACGWAPKVVSSCIHNTLGKHTWTMHLAKILHTFCVEKWGMLNLLCQYEWWMWFICWFSFTWTKKITFWPLLFSIKL